MKFVKFFTIIIPITIPIVTIAVLIYKFGYCFPYWDEILYVPLLDKLSEGTLSIKDLFFLQNNHRPAFPRLITLILAKITSWNEFVILYTSFIIVVLSFGLIAYIIFSPTNRKISDETLNSGMTPAKFISLCFISLFLFSWSQMENWVWGLQLMMFLTNLLCILVLFILSKYKITIPHLLACILFAVLASFSFANGLLIWFIVLPILIYKIAKDKKNYFHLLIWLLCAITVFIFYFTNYHTPSISKTNMDTGFLQKIQYFILYIGGPVSAFFFTPPWHGNKIPDVSFLHYLPGIIGVILWIFLLHKIKTSIVKEIQFCKTENEAQILYKKQILSFDADEYLFWKCLSLFSLLSGVLLATGRSGMGLGQALSSRYITSGCLFWCSIFGLLNFYIKIHPENSINNSLQNKRTILIPIMVVILLILTFSPIYLNQNWHQIARWKNLGWYALASGYDGRLYWTDLWGDRDFVSPETLKNELFPLLEKHNISGIQRYKDKNLQKELTKIFLEETKYFIEKKLWKPAICYLDTVAFLDPESPYLAELKAKIPPDIFIQYEMYQNEWQKITEKH